MMPPPSPATFTTFTGSPFPSLTPRFGTLINFDDLPTGVPVPANQYASLGVTSITQIQSFGGVVPPAMTFGGSQSPPNYVGTGGTFGWNGTFRITLTNPTDRIGVGIADSIGADTLVIRDAALNVLASAVAPLGGNTYFGFQSNRFVIAILDIVCNFCAFDDLQFNPAPLAAASAVNAAASRVPLSNRLNMARGLSQMGNRNLASHRNGTRVNASAGSIGQLGSNGGQLRGQGQWNQRGASVQGQGGYRAQ
jgi:hypothetical protein